MMLPTIALLSPQFTQRSSRRTVCPSPSRAAAVMRWHHHALACAPRKAVAWPTLPAVAPKNCMCGEALLVTGGLRNGRPAARALSPARAARGGDTELGGAVTQKRGVWRHPLSRAEGASCDQCWPVREPHTIRVFRELTLVLVRALPQADELMKLFRRQRRTFGSAHPSQTANPQACATSLSVADVSGQVWKAGGVRFLLGRSEIG
eukprot:363223-Chlamydomonas_euryale.AAC.8